MRQTEIDTLCEEISDKLKNLSEDKILAVYNFVSSLANYDLDYSDISAKELMFASEGLVAKDWNTPEENKAWTDL